MADQIFHIGNQSRPQIRVRILCQLLHRPSVTWQLVDIADTHTRTLCALLGTNKVSFRIMYKIDYTKEGLCAYVTHEFAVVPRQSRGIDV